MHTQPVNELVLYRHRYGFAYAVLAALTVILLVLNFTSLPPGMSQAEQASALASSKLELVFHSTNTVPQQLLEFLQRTDMVNLPYHALQKMSLQAFGLSPLGVRLPSLLLAGSSIAMLFVLLHRLMRAKNAVVMSMLLATSSWFIGLGRLGTPDIMVVFWTVLILLLAVLVSQRSQRRKLWKLLSLLSIGLSLYTPYMSVFLLAAVAATMTQPHLRYMARHASRANIGIAAAVFLLLLAPLGLSLWNNPAMALGLLNIPATLPGPWAFLGNLSAAFNALFNPFNISFAHLPQPLVALPIAVLALIGGIRLIIDWHSVRSHFLLMWLALLLPIIGLDTSLNLAVAFVPVMLLAAIGAQSLINYWYILFPRNPYARIFGFLPLSLLMVVIIQFNYQRYFLALPYAKETAALYDQDPFILTNVLRSKTYQDQHLVLVVPTDKAELYRINSATARYLTAVSPEAFKATDNTQSVIVAESNINQLSEQQRQLLPLGRIHLLVSNSQEKGLRFRIYTR